jgi:hypothetical protein
MKNDLEHLIDQHSLSAVLDAIQEICFDKAVHVAENWQDTALAKKWNKCANHLNSAIVKIEPEGL